MGSVKDLVVIERPDEKMPGRGQFKFSDRYSVFDWGEMPDHIPNKGAAICLTTAYFFEKLEQLGIKTHYLGVVDADGNTKKLSDLNAPGSILAIKLLRVLEPEVKGNVYDYSIYKKERTNFLIPLEIIYRNSLPEGSSVFKRLKQGSLRLEDLGLNQLPESGQILERPLLDVSTKLEASDRYLNWQAAKEIADLSESEIQEIKRLTLLVNELITNEAKKIGLINEDGKVEIGFDQERNLMLIDALGTLDECRFTYNGIPVSKEIARIYYRKTKWYDAVEQAKKKDQQHWKELCQLSPEPLPERLKQAILSLYCAYTNELTHREWFKNIPPLKEILKEINDLKYWNLKNLF